MINSLLTYWNSNDAHNNIGDSEILKKVAHYMEF